MKELFITNILIKNIRHLKNVEIPLDAVERRHLILTGRNGSGKTSVLLQLKEHLKWIEEGKIRDICRI